MQKHEIEKCKQLARRYLSMTDSMDKDTLRNKLFLSLQPFLIKWIKSIYSSKHRYHSNDFILSKSWDCFLFALNSYKPHKHIPFINHFFSYTKFCLLSQKIEVEHKEYKDNEHRDVDINYCYDVLEDLKKFRDTLPSEYVIIFEDAICSLYGENRDRAMRNKETPVHFYRYLESKKIFKIVIDYLVRK
jgi:hypothetical protein